MKPLKTSDHIVAKHNLVWKDRQMDIRRS